MSDVAPSRELHPTDPEVMACPFAYYADLHAGEGGARMEEAIGWVVAGHDDLTRIGKDPARFSSSFYGPDGPKMTGVSPEPFSPEVEAKLAEMMPMANALFSADPPTQTRQKIIATKALNPDRVQAAEPMMREEADRLIDGFIEDGRCEFLTDFAIWLPLYMICLTLGCVDRSEMERFKVWTDHIADGYLAVLDNPQRLAVLQSVKEFQEYMLPHIHARRESPTDDLLSALVNTEIDAQDEAAAGGEIAGPRRLTDAEILPAVSQLFAAGNHTLTNLLGNTMVSLIEHPEAMAAVRADHSLIPNALDESLRRDAPLRCTYRVSTQDVDVSGTPVGAGSLLAVLWGGAGHDPAVFEDPQAFDVHRANAKRHHSFGHGAHFCPGSRLARAQARIAFERLLTRLDDIRFAGGVKPTRVPHFPFSAYEAIELEFTEVKA